MNRTTLSHGGTERLASLGVTVGSVIAGIVVWQLVSTWVIVSLFLPPPGVVVAAFVKGVAAGDIGNALATTLWRVLLGFLVGSAVGIAGGLLMGSSELVRRFLEPYVNFFRFITPVAWASPAIIWFGFGTPPIVFLVFYTTVFIVLLNVLAAVVRIHRDRIRMAEVFGAGGWEVFRYIVVPCSVSYALTGMRIAMGNSFATGVSSEILISSSGLGYVIYNARVSFSADVMFACIVLLGAVGFVADRLFAVMQSRLFSRYAVGR